LIKTVIKVCKVHKVCKVGMVQEQEYLRSKTRVALLFVIPYSDTESSVLKKFKFLSVTSLFLSVSSGEHRQNVSANYSVTMCSQKDTHERAQKY